MSKTPLKLNTAYCGEALETLKTFQSQSVNCIVTSPPYYKQRKYGHPNELGQEKTPEEYVMRLCDILCEAGRVLRDDGTLWLNLADSYWGSGKQGQRHMYSTKTNHPSIEKEKVGTSTKGKHHLYKNKDLIGIPWTVALELRRRGWYLRQDNIWNKTNSMPESCTDRTTRSHEYFFMFSKSESYYYDAAAIRTPLKQASIDRYNQDIEKQKGSNRPETKNNGPIKAQRKGETFGARWDDRMTAMSKQEIAMKGANKRSVWDVATIGLKEDHYAAFPEELIMPCILAGCPEGGVVLDPFIGSGTTGIVAVSLNRKWIGIEIVSKNARMATRRVNNTVGLFN